MAAQFCIRKTHDQFGNGFIKTADPEDIWV